MPSLGLTGDLPADWKRRMGYVYVFENAGLRKIGSSKKPQVRLRALRTAAPSIEAIHHIPSLRYRELELLLHRHFADKRVVGEWFKLSDDDMDFIATIDGEGNQLKSLRDAIRLNKFIAKVKVKSRKHNRAIARFYKQHGREDF